MQANQKQTAYELALNCEQWGAAVVLAAYNNASHKVDADGAVNKALDKFGRTVLHHAAMRHAVSNSTAPCGHATRGE
jgi:hypothetical protein